MSTYPQGQTVQLGPEVIRDSLDVAATADTYVVTVVAPDGTTTTPTVAGTGGASGYTAEITVNQPGVWSYEWVFELDGDTAVRAGQITVTASPTITRRTFATYADIAARLGEDFTDAQINRVNGLLVQASWAVAAACGKDEDWIEDLSPVPLAVRIATIECVVRAYSNPEGARTIQEQLGQYGHTTTWAASVPAGIALTVNEERMVRAAVCGQGTGSVRVGSLITDLITHSGSDDWDEESEIS